MSGEMMSEAMYKSNPYKDLTILSKDIRESDLEKNLAKAKVMSLIINDDVCNMNI